MTKDRQQAGLDKAPQDPQPTTPFDVVGETGLLRLRYYAPAAARPGLAPVLIVYPMIKRPYILDLLPNRSVVRNLLRQGFRVYLTDWASPGLDDAGRGFDEYVNQDLARAVDVICARDGAAQVSLIGHCCAGLLCAVYAALHPERVRNLVTLAAPFAIEPPLNPLAAEQILLAWGNVPAWMVASVLNARMPDAHHAAYQLASDLDEPELVDDVFDGSSELVKAIAPWLASDAPIAGQIFLEYLRDALPRENLLESRMQVGGCTVDLANIDCPVLVVAGEHDAIVPARCTTRFAEVVGSRDASQLVFPTGHLGLILSRSAHRELWPEVGEWLRRPRAQPPCAQPIRRRA